MRPVIVHAAFELHVLGFDAEGSAGAFYLEGAGAAEVGGGEAGGGEAGFFDGQRLAGGHRHAVAEQGARRADLEALAAGLFGLGILDVEDGAVFVFPGEVAFQHLVQRIDALGDDIVEDAGLEGGDPQAAQLAIDGPGGGAGAMGFGEARQDSAFHAMPAGVEAHGFVQIVPVERGAGGDGFGIVHAGHGIAQQQTEQGAVVAEDDGGAQLVVVATPAEALVAEIIGHAALFEFGEDRADFHDVGRIDAAYFDGEAVGRQVAEAKFVGVTGGPLDADVGDFQRHDRRLAGSPDGEQLPADGLGVLEPGIADVAGDNVQGGGDSVDRLEGRHVDFLDFAIDVFAFAGRLVEGDFLHEKILGTLLDAAADAGKIAREIWKSHWEPYTVPPTALRWMALSTRRRQVCVICFVCDLFSTARTAWTYRPPL